MQPEKIHTPSAIVNVKTYLLKLQNTICQVLETVEGQPFITDQWTYAEGGGGESRVLADGKIIEKAGVNFSHVQGKSLPPAATAKRPELANCRFEALGVSVVI